MSLTDRIKRGWNAFRSAERQQNTQNSFGIGPSYGDRPDRVRYSVYNEATIISAIYTRLAIDVSGIDVRHVKVDDEGRYEEDMVSPLNDCLTLETNIDQAPRQFRLDIAMTAFDNGAAVVVPVDVAEKPDGESDTDIYTMRVGTVVSWYPKHVKVRLYNEEKGLREDIVLEKKYCAIIENPMYPVMNEPNSTLQRLTRKLALLDQVDEVTGSGKLDIIIQLPYTIKSDARRNQAEQRRKDIEFQLKGSQYGIAYADATEKITQLNRPAENNLLRQVEYLTGLLYNQLGLTEEVMNGTADEATMLNYFNRTIEPVLDAMVQAMQRSFLGHTGTKRGERIMFFQNPFKLVPINQLADIADKFTRNEILSSNEFRQVVGYKPSKDPKADELRNKNIPEAEPQEEETESKEPEEPTEDSDDE